MARFILAHEIGHLVLHDHYEYAFSQDAAIQVPYVADENSTEWQANKFAGHLLVPDHIATALCTVRDIVRQCGVLKELAAERLEVALPARKKELGVAFCPKCGGLVATRNGIPDTCDCP